MAFDPDKYLAITSSQGAPLKKDDHSGLGPITALIGEVIASGPGIANATLVESAVLGKKLTGFVASAGTVVASDSILQAFQKLAGSLVNFVGDTGSGGVRGLVPAPAAGDGAAHKFLRADGTWAVPAGGGGGTWGSITGTLSSQTDLQAALNAKLSLSGGTLTGPLTINTDGYPATMTSYYGMVAVPAGFVAGGPGGGGSQGFIQANDETGYPSIVILGGQSNKHDRAGNPARFTYFTQFYNGGDYNGADGLTFVDDMVGVGAAFEDPGPYGVNREPSAVFQVEGRGDVVGVYPNKGSIPWPRYATANKPPISTEGLSYWDTTTHRLTIKDNTAWQSVATLADLSSYLPLSGGTLAGALNMNSHSIQNVLDPTNPQDAATKAYVDAHAGGGGGGGISTPGVTVTNSVALYGNTNGSSLIEPAHGNIRWYADISSVLFNHSNTLEISNTAAGSAWVSFRNVNTGVAGDPQTQLVCGLFGDPLHTTNGSYGGGITFFPKADDGLPGAEVSFQAQNVLSGTQDGGPIFLVSGTSAGGTSGFIDIYIPPDTNHPANTEFLMQAGIFNFMLPNDPGSEMRIASSIAGVIDLIRGGICAQLIDVSNDCAITATNLIASWTRDDRGYIGAVNNVVHPLHGMFLGTAGFGMGYSGGEVMPSIANGTIKVKTGTNLTLDADAVSLNSKKIINLANPVNPQDAATKAYVDSNSRGQYTAFVSGAYSINFANHGPAQLLTLTGGATLTLAGGVAGGSYVVALEQDSSGSHSITFTNAQFPGGTAPTFSTAASKIDLIRVYFDGTDYLCEALLGYTDSGHPFTPSDIAGLMLWLDASDAATITGSSTASVWADKSGNANDATQSTGGNQPTISTLAINGLTALSFNGSSSSMNLTNAIPESGLTVFAVVKNAGTGGDQDVVNLWDSTNYGSVLGATGTQLKWWNGKPGNYNGVLAGTVSTTQAQLFAGTYDDVTGAQVLYLNGTQIGTGTITPIGWSGPGSIGCLRGINVQYWNGLIAEIVIYNTVLTTLQRQNVETYLRNKWNLY